MAAVARWQDPHLAPSRSRSRGTRLLASQCGQTICNASAMTSSHRGLSCKLCLARCFTLIGVNFSKTTRIAFCRNSFLSPCAAGPSIFSCEIVPPTRRLKRKIGEGHQRALKAINLAIKDRNGLVLGESQLALPRGYRWRSHHRTKPGIVGSDCKSPARATARSRQIRRDRSIDRRRAHGLIASFPANP